MQNTPRSIQRARLTKKLAAAALVIAPLTLAGCASAQTPASDSGSNVADNTNDTNGTNSTSVASISEGWAKSADATDMTGVFGTLENHTGEALQIDRVESDAADLIELHEVTDDGIMREIDGGITIDAHGTYELAPGDDHIMLMELTRDLLAGDEVTFTVFFTDGTSVDMTVAVKDYAGANEDYGDLHHHGHDHDHDHEDHGDDGENHDEH